jgi:hypothetical protein
LHFTFMSAPVSRVVFATVRHLAERQDVGAVTAQRHPGRVGGLHRAMRSLDTRHLHQLADRVILERRNRIGREPVHDLTLDGERNARPASSDGARAPGQITGLEAS